VEENITNKSDKVQDRSITESETFPTKKKKNKRKKKNNKNLNNKSNLKENGESQASFSANKQSGKQEMKQEENILSKFQSQGIESEIFDLNEVEEINQETDEEILNFKKLLNSHIPQGNQSSNV